MVVGIDDNVFWHLTPKTIQVYFKAYRERRKIAIQDIWLQGKYMACAIASTISFSKGKPPQYPEMPFKEEDAINEMGNDNYKKICYENRRAKLKRLFECHKKK